MAADILTTVSPITNAPILTRPSISQEELAKLPHKAQAAFRSFSQSTTLAQRKEIVAHALTLLEKKKDVLGRELTEQMGRPIAYTCSEITTAVKRGTYLNRISGDALAPVAGEAEAGFKRYLKKEPVGVVLSIFAWNVSTFILIYCLLSCASGKTNCDFVADDFDVPSTHT